MTVWLKAIEKSGHAGKVKIGTDVAASEFWRLKLPVQMPCCGVFCAYSHPNQITTEIQGGMGHRP